MTSVFNEYEGVAVVVPTLNEEKSIGLCLRSLLSVPASYPVIVADGGSSDATRAIVERLMLSEPRLRLIDNPRITQACAINLVASDLPLTYRWLVRADAHSLYPPDYVPSLLSACLEASSSSVVVRMRAIGRSWFERAAACAQNSALGNGGARHRNQKGGGSYVDHGHHALFDLDVFRAVGGYDESFTHNEDFELDHRIRQMGGVDLVNRLDTDRVLSKIRSGGLSKTILPAWPRSRAVHREAPHGAKGQAMHPSGSVRRVRGWLGRRAHQPSHNDRSGSPFRAVLCLGSRT